MTIIGTIRLPIQGLPRSPPPRRPRHEGVVDLPKGIIALLDTEPGEDLNRIAAAEQAPFPDEHRVWTDPAGRLMHTVWIPPTSTTTCVTGMSALNIGGDPVGYPGDWHKGATWRCPVTGVRWRSHYAVMGTPESRSDHDAQLAEWLAGREIVDARPALRRQGHPAGERETPVHCATHVRAVLELAWRMLPLANPAKPTTAIARTIDPRTTLRWLARQTDLDRLSQIADEAAGSLIDAEGKRHEWRAWTTALNDARAENRRIWSMA